MLAFKYLLPKLISSVVFVIIIVTESVEDIGHFGFLSMLILFIYTIIFNHTILIFFSFILPFNREHYWAYSFILQVISLIISIDLTFIFSAVSKYVEMLTAMYKGLHFAVGLKPPLILILSSWIYGTISERHLKH